MAEFPRYFSKASATTQQPSFLAPESTEGQRTEQIAKVAGVAQEATAKWGLAYQEAQKTQAELNQRTQLDDLVARAEADPDYNALEKYQQESEKITKDSLSGFKNQFTKGEATAKANYYKSTADRQLQGIFRKKMVDNQQANTMRLLDLEAKNPTEATFGRMKEIIDKQKSLGFLSDTDALKLEEKYTKQAKQNAFLGDLSADPSAAEENLSKNAYGFDFKELSAANKILKSEIGKIQATTQNDLLTSYLNGEELDTEAVKELMNQKRVTPQFAEGLINKIENPKPDELSKDESFITFQNKMADMQEKGDKATIPELASFVGEVMQAHSKGLLDTDDVKRILKDRNELLQKKLQGASEDVMAEVKPKTFFERISFWSDEYAQKRPEVKARMYRKLIDGVIQGNKPEDVLRKVMNDEIENRLEENLKKPDSDMVKMLSPDGIEYEIPKENVDKARARGFKDA